MPCNNCQKIISQVEIDPRDEKEIIKDLVNCKECSEKIIARCRTCHWPIYNHYLIYEDFGSVAVGIFIISFTKDWKLIQCDWCYKRWWAKKKKAEKWWKQNKWKIRGCEFLLLVSSVFLLCLKFFCVLIIILLLAFISFIYFEIIWPSWIELKRYRPRNRKPKPKK